MIQHPDRPDLDRAVARRRDPRGDLERRIEILGLDQIIAAELFAGLGADVTKIEAPAGDPLRPRVERQPGKESAAPDRPAGLPLDMPKAWFVALAALSKSATPKRVSANATADHVIVPPSTGGGRRK